MMLIFSPRFAYGNWHHKNPGPSLLPSYEGDTSDVNGYEILRHGDNQYMTVLLGRLKEHEGSIFRIAWSSDGSKFMSVSDDCRLVCFAFGSHCLCIRNHFLIDDCLS